LPVDYRPDAASGERIAATRFGICRDRCCARRSRRRMGISSNTVGNQVEHIYTKLDVSNRAGTAMRAIEHGLVGSSSGE
jgi:hypothetical protein